MSREAEAQWERVVRLAVEAAEREGRTLPFELPRPEEWDLRWRFGCRPLAAFDDGRIVASRFWKVTGAGLEPTDYLRETYTEAQARAVAELLNRYELAFRLKEGV